MSNLSNTSAEHRPLHLLADDLTGALDSAAAFATVETPVRVLWDEAAIPGAGPVAFDTGTREASAVEAAGRVGSIAPRLLGGDGGVAFKKIDSLLRGPQAEEISAALRAGDWRHCVVAPAFVQQGRITRGGRQGLLDGEGAFRPLDRDLAADLEALGHEVQRCQAGQPLPSGVSVWDAESQTDLDDLVDRCVDPDSVLWVGSAGLSRALARRWGPVSDPSKLRRLVGPILGLLGTDHPVTQTQCRMVGEDHLAVRSAEEVDKVCARLERRGGVFVTVALQAGIGRAAAARRIEEIFSQLAADLVAPGTLVVSGGETLRGLCGALGCTALDVQGEWSPGIPRAVLVGGAWNGTELLSKSGAFGEPTLLRSLLEFQATHHAKD